jgi:hypothetical protein
MLTTIAKAGDVLGASVASQTGTNEGTRGGGVYTMQCFDKAGNLKWEAKSENLVVNAGLKDMNDKYFTGSGYTATWFIGLYGAAASNNPAAGDTAASHAGWVEVTAYSQAARPSAVFAAATTADPSVISNTASPAVYSINGTTTVGGAFLISNSTKGGTTGVLFSAADFQSPGDRSVASGDTINVTYQFSLDAA